MKYEIIFAPEAVQDFKRLSAKDFDYRLENDPRFLARVAAARKSLREEKGVRLEDLPR